MKRKSREPSNLSESLHRHLNAYAMAASAAGVGVLAMAQPGEAKIVYTPAHHVIEPNSSFHLDLNHDGISDFTLYCFGSVHLTSASGSFLSVVPSNFESSGIVGNNVGSYPAAALGAGVQISIKKQFRGFAMAQRWRHSSKGTSTFRDPWANGGKGVTNRYLGFKFTIKKAIHYGWARLSVRRGTAVATLTGYAYQTIPNNAIITGKTKGQDVITLDPGSLGQLARGPRPSGGPRAAVPRGF